jgi:hypothetical protein
MPPGSFQNEVSFCVGIYLETNRYWDILKLPIYCARANGYSRVYSTFHNHRKSGA